MERDPRVELGIARQRGADERDVAATRQLRRAVTTEPALADARAAEDHDERLAHPRTAVETRIAATVSSMSAP
jgi:hypothetical protein